MFVRGLALKCTEKYHAYSAKKIQKFEDNNVICICAR